MSNSLQEDAVRARGCVVGKTVPDGFGQPCGCHHVTAHKTNAYDIESTLHITHLHKDLILDSLTLGSLLQIKVDQQRWGFVHTFRVC